MTERREKDKSLSYAALLCLVRDESLKTGTECRETVNLKEIMEFLNSEYFEKRDSLQHNPINENSTVVIPEIQITALLIMHRSKPGTMWADNAANMILKKIRQSGKYASDVANILEANFRSAGYIRTMEDRHLKESNKPEPIAAG